MTNNFPQQYSISIDRVQQYNRQPSMNPDVMHADPNPGARPQSVQEEMNHFRGLLQKSSNSRDNILIETESQHTNSHFSSESNKLSVILSASEGASSEHQGRKEENNYDEMSMNEFGSSSLEDNFIKPIIRKKTEEMLDECTPSTTVKLGEVDHSLLFSKSSKCEIFFEECSRILEKKNQQQLLEYFRSIIKDYVGYIAVLEKRNNENLLKKEKYRMKCEHLFRAFVTGREEEKRLLDSYIEQKEKIEKLEQIRAETEISRLKISKQLELIQSENMYLKELILVANKNYENLENKYLESEERFKYSEIAMRQKQIHFIEGNSVLKDVILNLEKDRKEKSQDRVSMEKERREFKQNKDSKENKENKHGNKHKSSRSVPPHQKGSVEDVVVNKKEELDDAYRRMFMKTLRGN